ncbi:MULTISPECIES: FHA domain-containing protein [Crateriforma]|nr:MULTISPECIES: FHA domain-containing protein [Crateriforma]
MRDSMVYKFVLVDTASGKDLQQWVLSVPATVGRSPAADITINDSTISRRHCTFTLDPQGALIVRDMGSTNGVYIDDQKVDKAVISPGMMIEIGKFNLRLEWTDLPQEIPDEPDDYIELDVTERMKVITPEDVQNFLAKQKELQQKKKADGS